MLNAIAEKSMGGTFSAVTDVDDGLSVAFSQCLAGLLTIVVQDLKLTLESVDSTVIGDLTAGGYAQKRADDENPPLVTVNFGDLYGEEVRKVIVPLTLAKVNQEEHDQEILMASFSYRHALLVELTNQINRNKMNILTCIYILVIAAFLGRNQMGILSPC